MKYTNLNSSGKLCRRLRVKHFIKILSACIILAVLACGTGTNDNQAESEKPDERQTRMEQAVSEIKYQVPDKPDIDYTVLDNIDVSSSPWGVVPLPPELGKTLNGLFSKYTKHMAPNGKPIHIFAQTGVSDLQVARAREILKYHLTDAPGTEYGHDKSALADRMADVRAALTYTDTEMKSFAMRPILRKTQLRTQDLYATESPVEGSYEYIHNEARPGEHFTRDASYEEIMHLVHDKGLEDVLPEYHQEIIDAEKAATDAGIYRYGRPAPHEYIITGFDVYFGLWAHDPQGDGKSFGDEYDFHTKEELRTGDPALYNLVEKFWPKNLTYNAYIDPSFEGTFVMVLDENKEYTFKSQHLVHVTLTGDKNTSILGNAYDNRLTGNAGDNSLTGNAGTDIIFGGEGEDTAVFSGPSSEYEITTENNVTYVLDKVKERDGTDELTGIEILQFTDKEVRI
jgi:hypothetical protein